MKSNCDLKSIFKFSECIFFSPIWPIKKKFAFNRTMSLASLFKSSISLNNAKGFNRLNRFHQIQSNQFTANQAIYIYLKGQVTIIQSINDKIEKIFTEIEKRTLKSSSSGTEIVGPTQSDIEKIIFLENVQNIANELISCKYMDLMKVINQSISALQALLNNQRLVKYDRMRLHRQENPTTDKNEDNKDDPSNKNVHVSDIKISEEEKIAQQLLTTVLSINMYFNTVRIETEKEQIRTSFSKTNNFSDDDTGYSTCTEKENFVPIIEKPKANQKSNDNNNKLPENSKSDKANDSETNEPKPNNSNESNSENTKMPNSSLSNQQQTDNQNKNDTKGENNSNNLSPPQSSSSINNDFVNDENSNSSSDNDDNDNDDDFVVCRICDEKVPIDEIDKHTKHCVMLYNSATFVAETDEKIRQLRDEVALKYLNENWPGEKDKALTVYIPVLNATLIIEQVLAINLNDADAIEQLTSYAMTFDTNFIKVYTKPKSVKAAVTFRPAADYMPSSSKSVSSFYANYVDIDSNKKYPETDISLEILNSFKPLIDKKLKASRAIKFHSDELHSKSLRLTKQANISDFIFLKRISSGAFARVFLARKKKTGDIYAIKVIPKSSLTLKNQVKRIMAEKDILLQFSNPNIVSFYYSIIGEHNLYLVMEYLPGGDLYSLLQHLGSLDEDTAKVYTYQIVNALKYLRENGIIHRDLKPDNILIAKNGVLKLTDFGLSFLGMVNRRVSNAPNSNFSSNLNEEPKSNDTQLVTSNSYVGTPDYIAPEILMNRPHSFAVDLWSLGVIIYEFLMGEPPFHGDTEKETHERILRGRYYIDDEDMSPESIDLISKLLKLNPDERIGGKDINEILNHPWLRGVNSAKAPFKPELNSKEDTNYFECRYELSEQDDKDILQDMELAANSAENANINNSSSGRIGIINQSSSNLNLINHSNSSSINLSNSSGTFNLNSPCDNNNNTNSNCNGTTNTTTISNIVSIPSLSPAINTNDEAFPSFGDSMNSTPTNSPIQKPTLTFDAIFRRSSRSISSSNSAPSKTLRKFLILEESPAIEEAADSSEAISANPSLVGQQQQQLQFNSPSEVKTSESFNEDYQSFNSPSCFLKSKNSSSTTLLPPFSLSCENSTDDDSLASFPSLLSPQMNSDNPQLQQPLSDPQVPQNVTLSAPGSMKSLTSFNNNNNIAGKENQSPLGIKFESVSLKSLAKENMRVANKVRRRRSISFSSGKLNGVNQRRNSEVPANKKYINLPALNSSDNDNQPVSPIKGSILTTLTPPSKVTFESPAEIGTNGNIEANSNNSNTQNSANEDNVNN